MKQKEHELQQKMSFLSDKKKKQELGEFYLQASQKQKHNTTLTTLRDRSLAMDHYKAANSGFDRNYKAFKDNLHQKMAKQDTIYNMTLGSKF